jgi:hypothetical protein
MKITTTQTETKTTEIEINFPTFTKVVDAHSTQFYCLKAEDDITRVQQYNSGGIINVSKFSIISDPFKDGFEFITQDEFMQYYQNTIDRLYVELSVLKAMLPKDTEEVEEYDRKESDEQSRVDDYCDKSNQY